MKIELAEEDRMDDGLHLNDDGYEVLSKDLRDQLINGSVDSGC